MVNELWSAEHVVEANGACSLIESQFPSLAPVRILELGAGWDNTAYLVNEAWVFRFPRRPIAVPLLEREARLLLAIAQQVSVPIPVPAHVGHPEQRFPWLFVGYRFLSGVTACKALLSTSQRSALTLPLARFLAELHAFPVAEAAALGAQGDELARLDVPVRSSKTRKTLDELVHAGLIETGHRRELEKILDTTPSNAPRPPSGLVHGDLYVRHVLVDEHSQLAGIIDWGDMHLGDHAVDLALGFTFFPPAARDNFLRAYGLTDNLTWQLARFRALNSAATLVHYAHSLGDIDLLREGKLALTWLAQA